MKKMLTILAMLMLTLQYSMAGTATLILNGSEVSDPTGFFSHDANGQFNFHAKYTNCTYAGIEFTKGLKMESSTKVLFTTDKVSTVTIVQSTSTNADNTIKFDGTELAIADATDGTGCRIYTINDVAAGDHNITRGNKESGLFYVKVEWDAYTATFDNTESNWDEVYAYTWSGEGANMVEQLGGWPGTQLTAGVDGKYLVNIESSLPEKIIFHNGAGSQTADFVFKNGGKYNVNGRIISYTSYIASFTTEAEWEHVYAYCWNNTEGEKALGEWPGTEITATDGVYNVSFEAEYQPDGILFHNNNGLQTPDYVFENNGAYTYNIKQTFTVTFTTNAGWETVYAYAWSGDGDGATKFLGDWPGTAITATDGVYSLTFQAYEAPEKILFNNGSAQTPDFTFTDGKAYKWIIATPIDELAIEGEYILNAENYDGDFTESSSFSVESAYGTMTLDQDNSCESFNYNVVLKDFTYQGAIVYGQYDTSKRTIYIPIQQIAYINDTYKEVFLSGGCRGTERARYGKPIYLNVNEDGTMDIDEDLDSDNLDDYATTGWVSYLPNYNEYEEVQFWNWGFNIKVLPTNATMEYIAMGSGLGFNSWTQTSKRVHVEDKGTETVVSGFLGLAPVSVTHDGDGMCHIALPQRMNDYTMGEPYGYYRLVGMTYDNQYIVRDYEKTAFNGFYENGHYIFCKKVWKDAWTDEYGNPQEAGYYYVDDDPDYVRYVAVATANDADGVGYVYGYACNIFIKPDAASAVAVIVTAPTPKTLTYSGEAQELIEPGEASGGTMVYSLDGTNYSTMIPTGTDAGEYTVYYKVVGDVFHSDTEPASIIVTIAKAESVVVTAPTPNTLTYSGEAQELIEPGEASGGTMVYSLDGTNFSTTIPVGTDAGEYTVYYKVEGDANYSETEPAAVSVTIADIDFSQLDNVMYIEPMEARAGTVAVISINMKNSVAIRGFQFDLYLPEGVTVVKSPMGKIQGFLSEGRLPDEDEHTLTFSEQPDGAIRFLCSSQHEEAFTGNDGEIATLKVNIAAEMADGTYPIRMRDMKLTETDISNYYETDLVLSKLTVNAITSYILGDINNDGVVDVSDYTGVANHIHGNTPEGFNAKAADVDESGTIDVSDYTGIANIIHTGSIYGNSGNAPAMMLSPRMENTDLSGYENVIYIEPFTASAGTQIDLSICMKNTAEIRGFQFDLYLPEGMTVAKTSLGRIRGALSEGRLPDEDEHDLTFSEQPDGAIRFLCSSQYEETFTGNDGEIATLKVNIAGDMADGNYPIQMKNMKLTETDISNYYTAELIETTVTIGEVDTRVVLDEQATTVPDEATGVDVLVKRTINADEWSTICLPFAMTEEQVKTAFGDDVELGDFTGYTTTMDDDDKIVGITVNFADVTDIAANHPYIIKVTTPVTYADGFTVDGVDIEPDEEPMINRGNNRKWKKFIGTYVANTTVPELCLFLSGNKFWYSLGLTKMKAFRAYFDFYDLLADVDPEYAAPIFISIGDETTRIDTPLYGNEGDDNYYSLDGRLVKTPGKGVYIKNGKKVIVK